MGKKKRAIISLMVVVMMLFSVLGTAFADESANSQEKGISQTLVEVSNENDASYEKENKQQKQEDIKVNDSEITNSTNSTEITKSENKKSKEE